jgi:beta-phosphoglucomutase family hydrolase
MLGLPAEVEACLFDLDGVLTDSAVLHAQAWADVFDEFLMKVAERAGRHFIPFDSRADYRAYIDGRPRLEGVHAFLASRGIALPEGRSSDGPQAETAYGLATRKGEILAGQLRRSGVTALRGARRYLQATGYAGVSRGVISASANTRSMLELAELASLAEVSVDADEIRAGGLRSRPAPDVLLTACRNLGVAPENAVTFTYSAAGVAAGHAAGMAVIGVGSGVQGVLLSGFGADRVVSGLHVLLDRRLVDGFERSSA